MNPNSQPVEPIIRPTLEDFGNGIFIIWHI